MKNFITLNEEVSSVKVLMGLIKEGATEYRWMCPGLHAVSNMANDTTPVPNNDPCDPAAINWLQTTYNNSYNQALLQSGTCMLTAMATNWNGSLTNNGIQYIWDNETDCQSVCPNCIEPSFNCKRSKFGNSCVDPGDGSGQYTTLQDCQEDCIQLRANDDDRSVDRNDDNPINPNQGSTCNATITHILPPANQLKFVFSGPSNWAYEITGPDPLGNINTLMSSNNSSAQTVYYGQSGYLNPGIYSLNYQCGVNNTSIITLPESAGSITIS